MFLNRQARRRAAALGRKSTTANSAHRRSQSSTLVTGSIAAGALMLAAPSAAFAQTVVPPSAGPCIVSGTTATCTGDVSDGVIANDPLDTINVNNLNQAIMPGAGVDGVNFVRALGDVTINADLGLFGIATTGGGVGLYGASTDGNVAITNTGDIDAAAGGRGIVGQTFNSGDVSINHTGNITASSTGIFGGAYGVDGNLMITSNGDVTSDTYLGIFGIRVSGVGDTIIDSTGNIQAYNDGIRAGNYGSGGDVMITSVGDITSDNSNGIFGIRVSGAGDTIIDSTGNIQAYNDGIRGGNYGSGGNVMITSVGDITSDTNRGIHGIRVSGTGNTIVDSTGNITSYEDGISGANYGSGGNVMITSNGDITSNNNRGIFGIRVSGDGDTIIDSTGNITTVFHEGIRSANYGSGGNVMITSNGDIASDNDRGIFGIRVSGDGDIVIDSTGNIEAGNDGIFGANYGSGGNVMITSSGDITSDNNRGIYGIRAGGTGNVTINSTGNIVADDNGIEADVSSSGNITINSMGDISSEDEHAIDVDLGDYTGGGNVMITSVGDLSTTTGSGNEAIEVDLDGDGNITVMSTGNINSDNDGIELDIDGEGDIIIVSIGNVTTQNDDGLEGDTDKGDISITSVGDLNTNDGGIEADVNGDGNITIMSTGNITSQNNDGIDADVDGMGAIIITSSGDITANSNSNNAIKAEVEPGSTATINILGGVLEGGDGSGDAVEFAGNAGAINILNTYGDVTLSSIGGTAIDGSDGDTTVNNWGTLNTVTDGDVLLGGGMNAFNNYAGGTFHSGAIVDLGAGNLFSNHGTFSPGGDGNIFTTGLTGQLEQTSTGILMTDVDMTAVTSDLLNVTETANLSGNVQVLVTNPVFGTTQNTILSAAGGTTDNGLGLLASPALQAALTYPNANDVVLSTELDFTAPGAMLNPNQTNVANTVSSGLAVGGGALDPVILALLNGPTDNLQYQFALDQLGGESFLNEDNAALFGAEGFGGQMFSCQVNGQQYAAVSEGSCLWVRPIGARILDRDRTATNIGFDDDAFGSSVGGQTEFKDDWFAGIALGFEEGDLTTDTGVVSERMSINAGLSLKHTMGAFAFSGALFGSTSSFDTTRAFTIGGLTATNMSSHNVTAFGARARGAYVHEFGGGGYVKPMVDFSLTHLSREGFTETGTAATALTIAGANKTYFAASPAVEFGMDHKVSDKTIRFYGKAGVTAYADDEHSLAGSFANAPAGTAGFAATTNFDTVFADVEAGFTIMDDGAATIQLGFQGRYSQNSAQSGGFIKANMEF